MGVSPMMRQYLEIKEQNPDAILFFRLGDFYEMFFEDAKLVSQELDLTLTGKDCGLSERAPMCGVPFHSVETYLQRLIEKGYKVAICEQMTDPALSKGLVERKVIRIVTPGTIIESNMLSERRANYLLCVYLQKNRAGCAFCDVSTGEFFVHGVKDARSYLADELARVSPSEVICNQPEELTNLMPELAGRVSTGDIEAYAYAQAAKIVKAHFEKPLEALGLDADRALVCASGALLKYLTDTQKNTLSHILTVQSYDSGQILALDRNALRNLELTQTAQQQSRRGSLLWMMDRTKTAMGSRLLREWIERPLRSRERIEARLDAVECLLRSPMEADALREHLEGIYDVERLLSRIAYDALNARDCLAISATLDVLPQLK
ncbi:MAG: DNA mismatch repair protein MutS, partial [Clostridia bacterium]|nr:DNA mismatch repair protein MutS [Clostridia bacterium]